MISSILDKLKKLLTSFTTAIVVSFIIIVATMIVVVNGIEKSSTVIGIKIVDVEIKSFRTSNLGSTMTITSKDNIEIPLSTTVFTYYDAENAMFNSIPIKLKEVEYLSGKKKYEYIKNKFQEN